MIVTAPAKINLSLRVLGKRADGYHELESNVVFSEYGDLVAVSQADDLSIEIVGEFTSQLAGEPPENNLVWKTAIALQKRSGAKLGAHITLTKNLPIGSGIGGGSADAAATLRALVKLWNIDISEDELYKIGLKLGADVPVCLYGKPATMRGVGEDITPATTPAQKYMVLLNPLIHLSTAEVFSAFTGEKSSCTNDLQPAAIKKLPIIAELINAIKSTKNCKFAQMSGSGATCFGLYESEQDAKNAANQLKEIYREMWCISTKIKE